MNSELKVALPTVQERKKLLGFLENVFTFTDSGGRRRPLEDPFPLRGGAQHKVPPKKFSTLPRKPKRAKMADKPPLAPKPPVPMPRKKGPPPMKPVPYRKHKEYKEHDVSTFKSNHPIQLSANKPTPPVPAEKPPRRYSAKGEPSIEFHRPKKVTKEPIQYGIPSIPGRMVDKGATISSRPRLNTPYIPPEPTELALSNDNNSKESTVNEMELSAPKGSSVGSSETLYTKAYDYETNGSDDVEGYAVIPLTKTLAKLPKLQPKTPPSPLGPKPPTPIAIPATQEDVWGSVPPRADKVPQQHSTEEYAVVSPTRQVREASPGPLSSDDYNHIVHSPTTINTQTHTGADENSKLGGLERNGSENVEKSAVPLARASAKIPKRQPRKSLPKPPTPTEENTVPLRQDNVPQQQPTEEYAVVSPTTIVTMVSPLSFVDYNHTVHSPTPQTHPATDEYSKLSRSDDLTTSPAHDPLQLPQEYSVITVPVVSPPPTGNPTQQAGYSQLAGGAQVEAEYNIISDEPRQQLSTTKPKVKAKKAFQKVKEGQLQSKRERYDFTAYSEDLVPMTSQRATEKPSPPAKPYRPPLTYQRTDAPGMPQYPSRQGPAIERDFSPPLSNQELERAGYETVNTMLEPEEDTADGGTTVPPRKTVISPKVEVDIDLINQIQTVMDGKREPDSEESSYGNQLIIEAVRPENTESEDCPKDPRVDGLVLSSTDMFTVPQHAIPGHLGYCDIDLKPPEQHQPVKEETINPGAGMVEGDTITVKHNSYPNAEGYCNLALNSSPSQTSVSGALANDHALYCDIDESSLSNVSGRNESLLDASEQPNSVNSTSHTYELVPYSPKTPPKSLLEDANPPATKPKPRRLKSEIDSTTQEETKVDKKSLKKAVTVDVPQRPARKAPPRRAPPPPPVQAAVDDNVLPRRDTSPRVAGDIATLPRGLSLLKSSPTTNNRDISLSSQQQAKSKTPSSKGLFSPKHEGTSPKLLLRFFGKKQSNSHDTSKINWRKKSLRANKDNPAVSPGTKARKLPATGRTCQDLPVPALDTLDDDDTDLYATIQETLQKPLPSPLASASPKLETRRSSGSSRDFEAGKSKQRSSFRKKKVKKNNAVRRTNSAEHLYDTAEMSGQGRPTNRARLPNPDEVHAGLYAMVTSRPVDNALQEDSASPTTNEQASNIGLTESRDKSLSPIRNSLYEQEGLVVTSLDKKFGTNKVDESFVSSADIEHTVSSEGSVYAIVQTRPKSRKSKSSASSDDTVGQTADSQPNLDQPPSQVPKKPLRSSAVAHKPPPYQSNSQENTLPKTATTPDNAPLKKIDCPVSTRSGPPSFPPPPPPQAKSITPEPAPVIEDPTYEVVDSAKKPKVSVPQKSKILTSVPAQKQPEHKSSQDEITSEDGYALVFNDHTDGSKDSELPAPDLVHINDALKTDSLRDERPPHLYSTIQRDEEPEESPTVSVRMVSHGYATVVDKGKLNGQPSKKKMAGIPRLAPRINPPPPPPSDKKRGATANLLPTHKPLNNVASTPLEPRTKSPEADADWTLNQRTSSFSQGESGQPKFLFSQKLCQSLIAVGDNPEASIPPSSNPLMMAVTVDEDSDADIMYSTEWESSTDEENEPEHITVHRPKIFYITREILTTERTFVKGLTLLDKDFRQAVRSANNAHDKPVIPDEAMKLILGNVSSLLSLNSDMLKDLEDRMSRWDEDPRIGDILKIRAPYFKIYTEYISKFDKALKALDEWTKKSPQFAEVVHEFEAQPKCASIPIAGYMLDVVQRITRYKMLMTDYVKHLPEDSKDREDSEKALEAISSTATHVNETIRQMDNFRKVVEVRKRLIGDAGDTLITPYRKLLKEGELLKFSRKERQARMFFLFNDILIYASSVPPANTTFKVIKRIPLEGMLVEPLNDPEMKYGFQIISTCKSFRLEASNKEEKTQWLTAFEIAIKGQAERMKNRERVRQILVADKGGIDETDSLPLGHLAPPWLPDSAVSMCQLCSVHFTLTRRRHHCRACGMIFCSDCSSYYASLKYMNNKTDRVCQSCYEKIDSNEDGSDKSSPVKRPGRLSRGHPKMVNMPSVLLEVKARDQNAQISGYLQTHTSKSKRWKKRWYVVYNLVLYEFERHEDVSAKRSITLPSYQVVSPILRHEDPFVFVLKHAGAGKRYFKVENEEQLERWVEILKKAVRGEIDEDEGATASVLSPEESTSLHSLDSQEPDSSSST